MTARFTYEESRLASNESAVQLAATGALEIATLYREKDLARDARALAKGKLNGKGSTELPACCELNAASKTLALILAKHLVGWGYLAAIKDDAAEPIRECARWKIETLTRALMEIEGATLECEPLSEGEEVPAGRRVLSVEVRP